MQKPIQDAMKALRAAIDELPAESSELKTRLMSLLERLNTAMQNSTDASHGALADELKQAVSQFEVEHPRLSGIANELILALGNMGI